MNYYKVFYWLTVADNARDLFKVAGGIFLVVFAIALIASALMSDSTDVNDPERKLARKWMWWSAPVGAVLMLLYVLTPSKRDSLLILAGGGTMNFLTTDSSAKQIPHELSTFVVSELKNMATDAKVNLNIQSQKEKILEQAKSMTSEQLVEK